MSFVQQITEALESLTSNKLRSALTILGIVIGVAAVISMLAIGRGAQSSIDTSIQSIGTNLLFISPGADGVTNSRPLTQADANALADPQQAPDVGQVAASLQGRLDVAAGGKDTTTQVVGITPNYANLRNITTAEGAMISDTQVTDSSAVALLGSQVATNLFGRTDHLVGSTVRIEGEPFQVIGVLTSKGGGALGSQDNQVLVPLTTAQVRLLHRSTPGQVDAIIVQANNAKVVTSALQEVTRVLRDRHHTSVGTDDFTILNQADVLNTAQSITGVLTLFLGGIGAISLLVGGIGIMNIMLVSVTERTREIGLRKALGARKGDILAQFLMESAVLGIIGGVLGVLLAEGIALIIGQVAASQNTPIHPQIGLDAVLLATLFSAAVGIFFGFYPANRAARLQPVEALRYE